MDESVVMISFVKNVLIKLHVNAYIYRKVLIVGLRNILGGVPRCMGNTANTYRHCYVRIASS